MGAELQVRHPIQTVESIRLAELICGRGGSAKLRYPPLSSSFLVVLCILTLGVIALFTPFVLTGLFCDSDVTPSFQGRALKSLGQTSRTFSVLPRLTVEWQSNIGRPSTACAWCCTTAEGSLHRRTGQSSRPEA